MLTNPVLNEQKLSTTVCVEIIFVLGWSSLMEGDKKKGKKMERGRRIENMVSRRNHLWKKCFPVYIGYNFIFAQPLIVFSRVHVCVLQQPPSSPSFLAIKRSGSLKEGDR